METPPATNMETQTDTPQFVKIVGGFWWGIYGDFRLVIDTVNNSFNVTQLSVPKEKRFLNWYKLKETKKLFHYFETTVGPKHCYEIPRYNKAKSTKHITGTYLYKTLFFSFTKWVSDDAFTVCSAIIDAFNEELNKPENLIVSSQDKISGLIRKCWGKMERCQANMEKAIKSTKQPEDET